MAMVSYGPKTNQTTWNISAKKSRCYSEENSVDEFTIGKFEFLSFVCWDLDFE